MTMASPAATTVAPERRRRWWIVVVGIAAVAVVALVGRSLTAERAQSKPAPGERGAGAGGGDDRPVPVQIAAAAVRDIPMTLEGLGTVTAYKTVNVRSQVDGRLDKVVFTEGQSVKRGQVLAEIDPRPFAIQLHQAEAALARDKAQLAGAERNLDRYQAVVKDRLIPQQQADDQLALVEQLRGTVRADQAQIENAKLQLDYASIKSPLDGVTGLRQVDPGNIVHAADATGIVIVTQLDPIAVIFTLPQDDLPRVAERLAGGKLTVQALSRDGNQLLGTGELALVDNQINQTTATIRLKAIFPNPDHKLWPNQFVKTQLLLTVRKGALAVPAVAVQRGPQGTFVYIVGDDGKAAARPVDVDSVQGEVAVLSKGVSPGEQVVIEGQSQLRPGARVQVPSAGGASGDRGMGPGGGARPGGGKRRQ
jgi:multidrug efflux system membrane fusion protein